MVEQSFLKAYGALRTLKRMRELQKEHPSAQITAQVSEAERQWYQYCSEMLKVLENKDADL